MRVSDAYRLWATALPGTRLCCGAILESVFTRTAQAPPDLDVNNLPQGLQYGDLPRTFSYGGWMWEAVDSGRFAPRFQGTWRPATG